MVKVGKWIAKHKYLIILISILLMIPSVIGKNSHVPWGRFSECGGCQRRGLLAAGEIAQPSY